jgi:hypothetical protein
MTKTERPTRVRNPNKRDVLQRSDLPKYLRRGYGFKYVESGNDDPDSRVNSTVILFMNPGAKTSDGVNKSELNRHGLRPHKGVHEQEVTFLEYVGRTSRDVSQEALVYEYQEAGGVLHTDAHKIGAPFLSISIAEEYTRTGGEAEGFWHRLVNKSKKYAIKVKVVTIRESAS